MLGSAPIPWVGSYENNFENLKENMHERSELGTTCSVLLFNTSRRSVKITFRDSRREFYLETVFVGQLSTVAILSVQQRMLDAPRERRYSLISVECMRSTPLLKKKSRSLPK